MFVCRRLRRGLQLTQLLSDTGIAHILRLFYRASHSRYGLSIIPYTKHECLIFLTLVVPPYQGASGCLVSDPGQYLNAQKGHRISLVTSFRDTACSI